MFTGIIEELGAVVRTGTELTVSAPKVAGDSGPGSSLSVNGVCLTVVAQGRDGTLSFDLSEETLARSSLGDLAEGSPVNLERPVTLVSRLGGHLVQGHVDGIARVESVGPSGAGKVMTFSVPAGLTRYIVEKGSVTMDGVSLTPTDVDGNRFAVALVPFTLEATTLGHVRPGDRVNVEVDVIAKYVEALAGGA